MKFLRLIFIAILSCLLVVSQLMFDSTVQTAIAAPATFFSPILGNISSTLPPGMTMRLPSYFINITGFRPQIFTGAGSDYFAVVFVSANCPQEFTGVCDGGRIFISRNSNAQGWLSENRRKGGRVTLANGIEGYYYRATGAASGARETLMWEQDGMVYGIISRILSESDTIRVATSMATGELFFPRIFSGGANCSNTINTAEARLRGDQNVGISISIESISGRYSNHPPNISFSVKFRMASARGNDIIASPRMMQEISQNMINNCGNLGKIEFHSSHQSAAYGIIDGQVTRFRCMTCGDNPRRGILNWGEY